MGYPAYIRDNFVMQIAFRDFVAFSWGQEEAHAEHCRSTGMTRPSAPASGIEAMIDEATGFTSKYAESFVGWLVATQWGEEE